MSPESTVIIKTRNGSEKMWSENQVENAAVVVEAGQKNVFVQIKVVEIIK